MKITYKQDRDGHWYCHEGTTKTSCSKVVGCRCQMCLASRQMKDMMLHDIGQRIPTFIERFEELEIGMIALDAVATAAFEMTVSSMSLENARHEFTSMFDNYERWVSFLESRGHR